MVSSDVLVTGASGFVGEYLAKRLARSGRRVVGAVFNHAIAIDGVETVAFDLRDQQAVTDVIATFRPAVVYHCAAMADASACEKSPELARSVIVDGTENLLGAVHAAAPDAFFVFLSTDLVFDGEHAPYREDSLPRPVSIYGRCKQEAEQIVLRHENGAVVRGSLIVGPPGRHNGGFLAWMVSTLRAGKRLPLFVDEWRSPVWIDDVCHAMEQVAKRRLDGIWHAGGPERMNRFEMGEIVCRLLEVDESLLEPKRLAELKLAAPRPRDVALDSSRLWRSIGHQPVTFEEAVKASLEDGGQ